MSATEATAALDAAPRRLWLRALLIALIALAAAILALWLLLHLFGLNEAPRPTARAPFGVTREAAPTGGPLAAWLLAMQAQFYRALTAALSAMRDGGAATGLIWIGFLYGVFHAAGPGHGKAVIAGYIIANERALARGLTISFAAAALQAAVAIAIVMVMNVALGATARQMSATTNVIEIASFAAMSLLGVWLLARKAQRLAILSAPALPANAAADDCGHLHAPPPEILEGSASRRDWLATVVAAGSRPCSGAIILLVFALTQNMLAAGIVGVVAMAAGTAMTTAALAALAVFFKQAAVRLASGRGRAGLYVMAIGETLVAALIAVIGAALAFGFWIGGAGS